MTEKRKKEVFSQLSREPHIEKDPSTVTFVEFTCDFILHQFVTLDLPFCRFVLVSEKIKVKSLIGKMNDLQQICYVN